MRLSPALHNTAPLRVAAYTLTAAIGSALVGCSAEPAPPEPIPPVIFVGSQPEGDPAPSKPPAFAHAEESLALALCHTLDVGDGGPPSGTLVRYDNKYTTLKQKYKLDGPQGYGDVSIQVVASDYCPEQTRIFGSRG